MSGRVKYTEEIFITTVRLPKKDHDMLMKLKFLTNRSMNDLIVMGVKKLSDFDKNMLTDRNNVVS